MKYLGRITGSNEGGVVSNSFLQNPGSGLSRFRSGSDTPALRSKVWAFLAFLAFLGVQREKSRVMWWFAIWVSFTARCTFRNSISTLAIPVRSLRCEWPIPSCFDEGLMFDEVAGGGSGWMDGMGWIDVSGGMFLDVEP